MDEDKPFNCDVCAKSFRLKGTLTTHKRIHTGLKPYSCDLCEKAFSDNSALIKHKRSHTKEKPYPCMSCIRMFSDLTTLTNHKRIHTGERPYVCDVCNKTFARSGALSEHKRIHTGEKPFKCDVCAKTFSLSSNLKRHKNTHGEKIRKKRSKNISKDEFNWSEYDNYINVEIKEDDIIDNRDHRKEKSLNEDMIKGADEEPGIGIKQEIEIDEILEEESVEDAFID